MAFYGQVFSRTLHHALITVGDVIGGAHGGQVSPARAGMPLRRFEPCFVLARVLVQNVELGPGVAGAVEHARVGVGDAVGSADGFQLAGADAGVVRLPGVPAGAPVANSQPRLLVLAASQAALVRIRLPVRAAHRAEFVRADAVLALPFAAASAHHPYARVLGARTVQQAPVAVSYPVGPAHRPPLARTDARRQRERHREVGAYEQQHACERYIE